MKLNPNVFSAPRAKRPRNSFDLSSHDYFTNAVGVIQPVFALDVMPGDFVNLKTDSFFRTQTLNTCAYTAFKQHVDFYFVPYRILWRYWTEFMSQVQNTDTNYNPNGTNVPQGLPYITAAQIYSLLDTGDVDLFGNPVNAHIRRVLDGLGYPTCNSSVVDSKLLYGKDATSTNAPFAYTEQFNPFRLLALNRIYHDFYRNSDWETNDPNQFNIDSLAQSQPLTSTSVTAIKTCIAGMYANLPKDRFTSAKTAPLYAGGIAQDSIVTPSLVGSVVRNTNSTIVTADTNRQFNAMSIRAMFALEKLGTISQFAAKNYKAQILARYGVKVDQCDYCAPQYLGSHEADINIGEVTATSSGSTGGPTARTSLFGQVGGKGVGGSSNHIKFEAKEFGVIIGVNYADMDTCYDNDYCDEFNRKLVRSAYYMPEFDNLGMQPSYMLNRNGIAGVGPSVINNVLGYVSRYAEYKSRVNRAHGAFSKAVNPNGESESGPLNFWVTSMMNQNPYAFGFTAYKCNPRSADSVFAVNYDGTDASDHFLEHFHFDCKVVRSMSIYGVPSI